MQKGWNMMKRNAYKWLGASVMAALTLMTSPVMAKGVEITLPGQAAETVQNALEHPSKQVNFDNMLIAEKLPAAPEAPVEETIQIDLRGAVSTAIENNRDIRISEYALTQAEAAVSEAAAAKNPSLSYDFTASRNRSEGTSTTGGKNVVTIQNRYSNGVNVSWPLWTGGRAEGLISAARYQRSAAEEAVELSEADTKLSATSAYYQYLEAINLEDVSRESVDNLTSHLTNVQQQYNAGIVAKLDVLSSNVSLANAKQAYITAQNAKDVAEANLNNIMRLPMSTKLVPTDTNFPEPEFTITMDQALSIADKNRWEIRQAEYAYKAAKEQVKVAKSGYLPTISVGGGYNWQDDDFPGFDNEGWSITGGLSWSLWDGGATDAQIKSAKAAMHSAEESLQQVRESVALEVRQDYLNILAAKEKIRATEAAVAEAEEAYKIATVRYKSGVGINLDVLDAQYNLNSARTNYITAMYDYNVGLATLEKALGIPAVIRPDSDN